MTDYNLKTIEEQWEQYANSVFTSPPSDIQYFEMKKSFYAGMWSAICCIETVGLPNVPEEVGLSYLEQIRNECIAFHRKVLNDWLESN